MSFKHQIGLHLRLTHTLTGLVQEAQSLGITSFQFFLISQQTQKYVVLEREDKNTFVKARTSLFADIYIHSSYWINPAAGNKHILAIAKSLLLKEMRLAAELDVKYLVLHPGSAKGYLNTHDDPLGKKNGTYTLARLLNTVCKQEPGVTIVLENNAHGQNSLGNDLEDFKHLRPLLDFPERIKFCIDYAHAFSYGYDLTSYNEFVATLDRCMGLENIQLIHFNDTADAHGSMQDRHAFPGKGNIGQQTLKNLLNHTRLTSITTIIEGPDGDYANNQDALKIVRSWCL